MAGLASTRSTRSAGASASRERAQAPTSRTRGSSSALTAPSRAAPPDPVVNEHQRTRSPPCVLPWSAPDPGASWQTKEAFLTGTATEGEQAAVLSALAGVRKGDPVAVIGCGRITE